MRPPYFPTTGLYVSFVPCGIPMRGALATAALSVACVLDVVGPAPGFDPPPPSPRSHPTTIEMKIPAAVIKVRFVIGVIVGLIKSSPHHASGQTHPAIHPPRNSGTAA